jgi:hypothetical protein
LAIKFVYPAHKIGERGSIVVPQRSEFIVFKDGMTAGNFKGALQETKTGRFLPPEELLLDNREYFVN